VTRAHWLVALMVAIELGVIVTHPAASKAMMAAVYDFGWSILPKPEGFEPPHRFR